MGLVAATLTCVSPATPPDAASPRGEPTPASKADDEATFEAYSNSRDIEVATAKQANARDQAAALTVVELETAKRQTHDMGQVLAQSRGVTVRRAGGLGSRTVLSIHGLSGDRVRMFVDGVPADHAGFGSSVADVPVDLVDHVDLHRGVVPIDLGADALGGAVNIKTVVPAGGTHGSAAIQLGAFGTYRLATTASHHVPDIGGYMRATAFLDRTDNDFEIDVDVPSANGQLQPATVSRFHDSYDGRGITFEFGAVERWWARRLVVRGHFAAFDKEIQHNFEMSVPYGEVHSRRDRSGATMQWSADPHDRVRVDIVGSHAYRETEFVDVSTCVYDWHGRCVFERAQRGEIDGQPYHRNVTEHGVYGRLGGHVELGSAHSLGASVTPRLTLRSGLDHEAEVGDYDPFAARRTLVTIASGLDHDLSWWGDRVRNVAFVKHYDQRSHATRMLPSQDVGQVDVTTHAFGAGESLRVRLIPGLWLRGSYEWALRLPNADELFGDGVLLLENLALAPERSHNGNVGASWMMTSPRWGALGLDATGFRRHASDMIVMLATGSFAIYENVLAARIAGVEGQLRYESPGDAVRLDVNATWVDPRNRSHEGPLRDFHGDRLPNQPLLLINGSTEVAWSHVVVDHGRLAARVAVRHVGEFFRSWESLGDASTKMTIAAQTLCDVGINYMVARETTSIASAFEVHNVFDQSAFDFYGVARPGRAAYAKLSLSF